MRVELEDRAFWQEWMAMHTRPHGRVIGAGAAAKATVWLNFMGFTTDDVEYVVDSTPTKVDKFIPGTDIPIFKVDMLYYRIPTAILVLAHNYCDEIVRWLQPCNCLGAPIYNVATRERVS